jgi:hypothetical protein
MEAGKLITGSGGADLDVFFVLVSGYLVSIILLMRSFMQTMLVAYSDGSIRVVTCSK